MSVIVNSQAGRSLPNPFVEYSELPDMVEIDTYDSTECESSFDVMDIDSSNNKLGSVSSDSTADDSSTVDNSDRSDESSSATDGEEEEEEEEEEVEEEEEKEDDDEEEYELELWLPAVRKFFNLPPGSRPTNVSFECTCCTRPMAIAGLLKGVEKAVRLKCEHIFCFHCALKWWLDFTEHVAPCPFCRELYDYDDVHIIHFRVVLD